MSTRPHWLGGWGVSPEETAARLPEFPEPPVVFAPTGANLARLLSTPANTPLGGWSLGAHLLLTAMAESPERFAGRRVTLVCPFLGFPEEAGGGGRIRQTQLRVVRRWIRGDAAAALADFHQRAGIAPPGDAPSAHSLDALLEGLDFLEKTTVPDPTPGIRACASIKILGGENDPLIDNARLQKSLPDLRILPGAGHDLADFSGAIAG